MNTTKNVKITKVGLKLPELNLRGSYVFKDEPKRETPSSRFFNQTSMKGFFSPQNNKPGNFTTQEGKASSIAQNISEKPEDWRFLKIKQRVGQLKWLN